MTSAASLGSRMPSTSAPPKPSWVISVRTAPGQMTETLTPRSP